MLKSVRCKDREGSQISKVKLIAVLDEEGAFEEQIEPLVRGWVTFIVDHVKTGS